MYIQIKPKALGNHCLIISHFFTILCYSRKEFPAAWMNLGIVLGSTRRYEEALTAYKTALYYKRNYPDCYYNLGNLVIIMNYLSSSYFSKCPRYFIVD